MIKRVYEPAGPEDGYRILVDRLWPRGLSKEQVQGVWLKDAAPSAALRNWYGHDPAKWPEFKTRYFSELDANPAVVARLKDEAAKGPLTLLYASRNTEINQAVALREYLLTRSEKTSD